MFATNINVENFSNVFSNMNITGEIPAGLFAHNTKARNFAESFSNDSGITKINDGLFNNNSLATNYYHTFYKNTSLTSIPENLFNNNIIGSISNDEGSHKDYRGTFEGCTGLVEELKLDVHYIGREMFKDCTGITKLVLPTAIEVGAESFYGCNNMKSIKIIKENFVTIGQDAFEYTLGGEDLLTYINIENEILYNYNWPSDHRRIDKEPPKGTVEIVADKYPFTKIEDVMLHLTVTDDISKPEDCYIAIINDSMFKEFNALEIAEGRVPVNEIRDLFNWRQFQPDVDLAHELTAGEGIKTVYVYFMDEMGNISNVKQDLDLVGYNVSR